MVVDEKTSGMFISAVKEQNYAKISEMKNSLGLEEILKIVNNNDKMQSPLADACAIENHEDSLKMVDYLVKMGFDADHPD